MLADDRKRAGWSVEQAAWRLGVSVPTYREIEAAERVPAWEMWDRIYNVFGWGVLHAGCVMRREKVKVGERYRMIDRRDDELPEGTVVTILSVSAAVVTKAGCWTVGHLGG